MARAVVSIGLTIFAAGSSFASYDLMFVQANLSDAGTGLTRVHRIDPANGLQLGSFTIGPQSFGLAASRARGELYTADINGNLRTWDYSTGNLKRFQNMGNGSTSDIVMSPNGNEIISLHNANEIRTFNVLTGASTSSIISGTTLNRITVNPDGVVFAYDAVANQMRRITRSGSTYSLQSSEAALSSLNFTNMGQLSFAPGSAYDFLFMGSRTNSFGYNYLNLGANSFAGFGGFGGGLTAHSTVQGFVPAHVGSYGFGDDSSTPGNVRVTHIDPQTYFIRSFSYSGISGGARNATIVLAPEPGSFAILALGLACIARRKSSPGSKK